MNVGDDVIVFLAKDPDSIYIDYHYMVGIESGIYKIDDGMAKNDYVKSSYDANSFKDALKNQN